MKKLFVIGITLFLILPCFLRAEEDKAVELVRKMDDILRGTVTGIGDMTMIIHKKRWRKSRTIGMKFWELKRSKKEQGKSYILITAPISESGKGFLKIGTEMWSYFPDVNSTAKIPPSMMLQSWMGSDFTNDDLVRESSIVLDYDHRILKSEEKDGHTLLVVELVPKPNAPVTWGKILVTVREADAMPFRQEFYNEKGKLVRVMTFKKIKTMAGRTLPTVWTILPKDKPGDKTILILNDIQFDVKISPSVFTMANLRKGGE